MIKSLQVFKKDGSKFGLLLYNSKDKEFTFKYDKECTGYRFGELNVSEGKRVFKAKRLFNPFYVQESWSRANLVENNDIENIDSNEAQWHILEHFITVKNDYKGFYFERV